DKVEQKDENVEEEKEKKEVPDYKVWDKTKAIVPFVDYHDYEINDTQSSTKDAEYNDNVSGVTQLESEKISDPSLVVHQMIKDMTKLPLISRALKEATHDVLPVDARLSFNKLKFKLK
nr:hypothetical protein [Tanacetum cinerariifolium]